MNDAQNMQYLTMAAGIVSAYLSNNTVAADQIPSVIETVHRTLTQITSPSAEVAPAEKPVPAVAIKRSVTADYIVCLEDGKKLKMLKRHLRSTYNMTPEEYRAKWGLPLDYPMVAPNYAAKRSEFAKSIGLGRRREPEAVVAKGGRGKRAAA